MKKYIKIILFTLILMIIDLISKETIIKFLNVNETIKIINNFFEITYVTNTGAALGMFNQFTALLIVISLIIMWYIISEIRKNKENKIEIFSLTLLLGGALGNLFDRIYRGYVIDFLSFKIFNINMPIFNIADIFITVGVILLIICTFRESKK